MADVKFNINQWKKPTPRGIERTVKIITVLVAVFGMWLSHTGLLSVDVKEELAFDAGLITTALHLIAPFFGIDIDDSKKIPAKDIDVMQNKQ